MPLRTIQTSLTAGMLDPSMREHVDLAVYRAGAKKIVNARLLPQGGATRRPGLPVMALLTEDDYQIEPFIFSGEQAYTFLFFEGGVDIWNKNTRTFLMSLAGPWTAQHIADNELRVEQQLDKMFVSHEDFKSKVITRTGASTFSIADFAWSTDAAGTIVYQPYHKFASPTVTLTPSATAVGAATVTASSAIFTSAGADYVGLKFRYRKKQMTVTSKASSTVLNVTIDEVLPSTAADYDWDEQAFSVIRGWARCVCLHAQRLWVGGGRDCPNVVWGSTLDDPFSMNLGTGADDEAIKYTIYAKRVAQIISMVSNGFLQIFTTHGEFYVPNNQDNTVTPSTMAIIPQSRYGSSNLQAREFDGPTIFVTAKAEGLREFSYDAVQSSFSANALTFMSKSLLSGPRDLDVQMEGRGEEQESRAYISNDDGTIAVLSKVSKENIAGWSYWDTQGSFKRLGVIDSEVWAITERTINNVTSLYLEIFDRDHLMDFSKSDSGAASSTWGPYNLHKGQSVHVVSDDLYLGEFTINATTGMLTLDRSVTSLEFGLNFEPEVIPLQQHVQLADGVSVGEPKRYVAITAMLEDTLDCRIKARDLVLVQDDPDVAPERYTGKFKAWCRGWNYSIDVPIKSTYPLPWTVNSIITEVEV